MVSNRLKADARVHMKQNPGTSYQHALRAVTGGPPQDWGRSGRELIDGIIGQDEVKERLRWVLSVEAMDAERRRRGLIGSAVIRKQHFIITGEHGTGKSYVARVLARLLQSAGGGEADSVVVVGRHDLVGTSLGGTERKTAAVFDKARGGVLIVEDGHDLVQHPGRFGREALCALAELARNDRTSSAQGGPVVVLVGYSHPLRQFVEHQVLAGIFELHIEVATPSAKDLWTFLGRCAEGRGFTVDADVEAPFVALVEKLQKQFGLAGSALDRLGNLWFVTGLVDRASGLPANRLAGVEDLSSLTDEELFRLTVDDVVAAARMVMSSAGLMV
ncbi:MULTISPECIES: AAA family ATPase [Mycolicibacter]|uniref:AAA family ATPase n=2 Tax=Mycolicibacter TaxID=1073531 RepID=A0ABU5XM44_9MYCO|nr:MULTISPECIES: AAA family ATPase [unclassified Mycolicibacter]MEB3023346.1 AAA family ATPase [Mycolicibacter sp. MYC098]MEB3033688.1 AAA family ATPase [Mycolicibacter sp. MYC340]